MSETRHKLPVIYSAHHASSEFPEAAKLPDQRGIPGGYAIRTAMTGEQQVRFSDYGSNLTVPRTGILTLESQVSRGMVDLNRAPDSPTLHPTEDFGRPEKNKIWRPGMELTEAEKKQIKELFYDTYHDRILQGVETFPGPGVVVAWDNTAHYEIGNNEAGKPEMMKAIILSNRGLEDRADNPNEATSCDPQFLLEMAHQLQIALKKFNLPDEVRLNLVYKGGYIGEHYNDRRNPQEVQSPHGVQSFQVEYDTLLTHDQETLQADHRNIERLRKAFELAMHQTYVGFLKQS